MTNGWAVKDPSGYIFQFSFARTKQRAIDNYLEWSEKSPLPNSEWRDRMWKRYWGLGYKAIAVKITGMEEL